MKFELHFDKDIYNKQMSLLCHLAWKDKVAYYKNSQYLGLLLIIIGITMIYNRPNILGIGYFFVFFGLSNFVPFVYYYFQIKSFYRKIEDVKIKEIEVANSIKDISWEFTEIAFIESSENHSNVVEWREFVKYIIIEKNLIMITKEYQPYILGEIEVGLENFENITSFIKTKIGVQE